MIPIRDDDDANAPTTTPIATAANNPTVYVHLPSSNTDTDPWSYYVPCPSILIPTLSPIVSDWYHGFAIDTTICPIMEPAGFFVYSYYYFVYSLIGITSATITIFCSWY